jgi:cobalt-zinc-cadmium resistance protein CzcA
VGGLVFSVTLVPVMATFAYRKERPHRESPILVAASRAYVPALRACLRRPGVVILTATIALVASGRILATRGSEFLPELNEGAMYLTFTLPANTSLTEGRRLEPVLTSIIDQFPQVESRISQLGRPEDGTDPKLVNNLEVFVKLRPAKEWPHDTPTIGTLMDKMNDALVAIPGVEVNFSQPIRDNVNESIAGQQGQVALKIFATDPDDLRVAAEQAKAALAAVPGIADLGIVKSGVLPQVQVKPRRALLGRFGGGAQVFDDMVLQHLGHEAVHRATDGGAVELGGQAHGDQREWRQGAELL